MSDITLTFDTAKLVEREKKLIDVNQMALDYQVLKNSNEFVPMDVGTLKTSGKVDKPGEIIWDEIYAKRQYYELPNKSKDKNMNARNKWFEEAKVLYLRLWLRIAQGNI